MSSVSENARPSLMIADFAQNQGGKLYVVGGNVQILGFDPRKRTTARFSVVAQVELDSLFCPAEFQLEITLLDSNGDAVPLPGAKPVEGEAPKQFRVSQRAQVARPAVPGVASMPSSIPGTVGIVIDFGNGIPVMPGQAYAWQLRIDEDSENAIYRPFYIPGPPQATGPVFG